MDTPGPTPRAPRRRLAALTLLLCVGLGLLMNAASVVVGSHAVALADLRDPTNVRFWMIFPAQPAPPPEHKWPVPVPSDWPSAAARLRPVRDGPAWSIAFAQFSEVTDRGVRAYSVDVTRVGWPLRSAMMWQEVESSGQHNVRQQPLTHVKRDSPARLTLWQVSVFKRRLGWTQGPVTIPLYPLWSGLIANTTLYAGVALSSLMTASALRRTVRRRRGRCPACAYSHDGLPDAASCPECGTPSPAKRVAV